MKVMVLGAKGMLGQDLVPVLQEEHEVFPYSHEDLDITKRETVWRAIKELGPDLVINCAAYTDVDKAESEREKAYAVNALGVQNIALACADFKAVLLQISTDYVFDGQKRTPYLPLDQPNPINWYGYTKYAGEKFVEWHLSRFYILRTSWLYGKHGKNFVSTILKLAQERDHLEVVNDQIGAPTHTKSLAKAILWLIKTEQFGIHHYTDFAGEGVSWYEFASKIVKLAGLLTAVKPIETKDLPRPAKRPAYSTLEVDIRDPAPWEEELEGFLKELEIPNLY
ncbi:MAG: dTDP-4-dehydrorhamnose reductase [Coprothermobacterota bacterium]|nr:dTDP-4-dehydrorhamnose reductase [Coprothermobacterota bacterium]